MIFLLISIMLISNSSLLFKEYHLLEYNPKSHHQAKEHFVVDLYHFSVSSLKKCFAASKLSCSLYPKHTSIPVCYLLQMHRRCLTYILFCCSEFRTTPEGIWNAFCILFKPIYYCQSLDSGKFGEFVSHRELSLGSTGEEAEMFSGMIVA